jgi:hypothetical protein
MWKILGMNVTGVERMKKYMQIFLGKPEGMAPHGRHGWHDLDVSGSESGYFEKDNELSESIKGEELLNKLSGS